MEQDQAWCGLDRSDPGERLVVGISEGERTVLVNRNEPILNDDGTSHDPLEFKLAVHSRTPGVVVVSVAGELDMLTEPRTRSYVHEQLRCIPQHLVIDLSRTSFLSARGVRMLINTRTAASEAGVHLLLAGVHGNPPVQRILGIVGATRSFDIRSGSIEEIVTDLTSENPSLHA